MRARALPVAAGIVASLGALWGCNSILGNTERPIMSPGGQSGNGGKMGTGGKTGIGGHGGTLAAGGSGGPGGSGAGGVGSGGQAAGGRGGQSGGATGGGPGAGSGGSTAGSGGASGAGGNAPPCQNAAEQCDGTANGFRICTSGQWGSLVNCGPHQSCMQSGTSSTCVCNIDPVCSVVGSNCANPSTVASCAQDGAGCFYQSASETCTAATGSCTTAGTSARCCQCASSGPQCTGGACPGNLVCERSAPTACADANWAQWPMPNGPADVSSGAANAESYTDNGDGTVTDKVTGLMWQQGSSGASTWAQAVAYCPALSLAGHKDWRLPTLIELLSLVDYSIDGSGSAMVPSIDATYFPSTMTAYHWTSTPLATRTDTQAWIVNFNGGSSGSLGMTATGYARCVR